MPSVDPKILSQFIASAEPGQSFEYHRGRLDRDLASLAHEAPARVIRRLTRKAYDSGNFELVAQRHGFEDYSYLIRRRRPATGLRRYG